MACLEQLLIKLFDNEFKDSQAETFYEEGYKLSKSDLYLALGMKR